ncbi:MAG: hypothetical protein GWN87_17050 [Desulfuromonadales bacterium]|nr:hypothetical protein [Desulfuromonadales bacterium]
MILDSDGVVSVTGPVEYVLAGPDDSFSVFAGERIQFVLDANATIYMVDDQDVLTGTLTLSAPSIFAADSDLLDQIIADPLLPGLQDLLAEEPGFSEPGAYIEADTVFLFGEDYIYTQNWGASGVFSAVAVGPGGLTVAQEGDALPNLLNAIVFGIQVNGLNDFTSNANFFRLVTFNMEPSNHFTNESTLNLCFIVSGVCGSGIPVGEGQIEPPITNSTYTAPPPLVTRETTEIVEQNEEDNSFGLDFPSMFSAETVDEQTNVTQPVTSGGDNALYGDPLEDDENDAQ